MSSHEPLAAESDSGLDELVDLMASPMKDGMVPSINFQVLSNCCIAQSIPIAELEAILKRPPFCDLDPYPRLPVTPSMLYTYAHMLGKHPGDREDTLHSALFPGRNRRLFRDKLWLPIFRREQISIEE